MSLSVSVALLASAPLEAQGSSAPAKDGGPPAAKQPAYPATPPPPGPVKTSSFPPVAEKVLPNGLIVLAIQQDKLPLLAVRLVVKAGVLNEGPGQEGLAELAAELLDDGTPARTSKEIANEIDFVGGNVSIGAGHDSTTISADTLTEHADTVLAIVADLAANASFPKEEVGKEVQRKLAELVEQRGQADFLAQEQFMRALYGTHPYGRISPTAAQVSGVTQERLVAFRKDWFRPNNAILVLAGALTPARAFELAAKHFGTWQRAELPALALPPVTPKTGRAVVVVERPASVQSNVMVGGATLDRAHADYLPLSVTSYILGGGPASRLFLNLREAKGYTYGAYARVNARLRAGDWYANTEVRNEVTKPAIDELFAELERLREEPVTAKDLANAQSFLAGVFAIQNESIHSLAANAAQVKLYGLPADYWNTYRQKIYEVDATQVKKMARTYIDPQRAVVVVVGNRDVVLPAVERFGAASSFDVDGNPIVLKGNPAAAPPPATK